MSDRDLIYLSASESIPLFKSKKLSPVEVLQAQIEQAEGVESQVSAFTTTFFDQALKAAKASEQRYMRGNPRPLEGVTVAVKDEHSVEGWTITQGSLLENAVSESNSPLIEKLLDAGAVLHAQTTVPEYYVGAVTWTKRFGVTRNPWNLHFTVGGSSGGAAAALAAGTTTLSTGSDMGGSIRIPCAFCGLYGVKPPFARVPPDAGGNLMPFASDGPLARTFADMVLMQSVIAGSHPSVHVSLRPDLELPLRYEPIKGMRIAFDMDQGWAEIDPEVRAATEAALQELVLKGAIVEEVDLGWNGDRIREGIIKGLLSGQMGSYLLTAFNQDPSQMTSYARAFGKQTKREMGPNQTAEAGAITAELYGKLGLLFEQGVEALICPTLATPHVPADYDATTDSLTINGVVVEPNLGWVLTPAFNLLNRNPVVNVPIGISSKNVPIGMQIVAPTYDDLTAFRVAAAFDVPSLFTGDLYPDYRNEP